MKSIVLGALLVFAGMMSFSARADARVVVYEGPCGEATGGTGNWIIVMTIDDATGEVTRQEGVNCGTGWWVDHCDVQPGNLGTQSDHYEARIGVNGQPLWWVRCNVNALGDVTTWGMRADGTHWTLISDMQGALE